MRLFTGIDLSAEVVTNLERLLEQLRPTASLKWSPPSNLHITTKFIGEWPQERLSELNQALQQLPRYPPISITVQGLGFFPNPRSPRVFWAGVTASPDLASLAYETERALCVLGLAPEKREYSAHLTLARIGERVPHQAMKKAIADLSSLDFGSFLAGCFYLYLSRPGRSGSVYTKLSEFPLSK